MQTIYSFFLVLLAWFSRGDAPADPLSSFTPDQWADFPPYHPGQR